MMVVAWAILIACAGLVAGLVQSGSITNLQKAHLRGVPLLAGWCATRILLLAVHDGGAGWGLIDCLGLVALIVAALANRSVIGSLLVAGGTALNLLVTLIHLGTPVQYAALVASGATEVGTPLDQITLRGARFADAQNATLWQIGERIGMPFGTVISFGDIMTWSGIALAVWYLTQYRRPPANYSSRIAPLGDGPAPRRGPGLHPSRREHQTPDGDANSAVRLSKTRPKVDDDPI